MASVVGQASAAATSVAIPAHQPGDLILVSARGTVAPSVPAAGGTVPAWTTLQSSAQFSIALTTVSFVATASNHTTGVFTNATHIGVVVIRAAAGKTLAIGASSVGGANNATTLIYPALTLQAADGSSFGVRIGTRVTAATQLATNMPTSWTKQIEQPATTAAMVVCTRAALAANPVADTVTAGAANAAYRAHTVEVRELTPATVFGSTSLTVTFGRTVSGQRKTFSSLALPIAYSAFVDGQASTAAQTYYGSVSLPMSFSATSNGQRKTFGQLQSPLIFGKAVAGQRKTFGQIAFPINAAIAVAGVRRGLTLYGALAMPITFAKDIRGQRKTFGQVAMPLAFVKDVRGQRKTFGLIDFPIIFTKEATGRKQVFGQLAMQTLFGKETAGQRKTFGQILMPLKWTVVDIQHPTAGVAGRRTTFGQIALPIGFYAVTNGQGVTGAKTLYGQLAMPLIFSKQVVAHRKTFGKITAPFVFGSAFQGRRLTHGRIAFPIVVGLTTSGKIITVGTAVILNDAHDLYLGEQNVDAAFVGLEKVWPALSFSPLSISGLAGWYDASQLKLADGALVNPWPDLSGYNRDLVSNPAVVPGSPPSVKVNGLNGKRVVHYASAGDNLLTYLGAGGVSYGHFFMVAFYTHAVFADYDGLLSGLGGDQYLLIGTAGLKNWYGPGGGGTWDYYYNGIDSRQGLPAPMQEWAHLSLCRDQLYTISLSIGLDRTFGYLGRYWHGDIAEIIAYDRKLPTIERQQVETYLKTKWGI